MGPQPEVGLTAGVWAAEQRAWSEPVEGCGDSGDAATKLITLADLHNVHVAVEYCLLKLLSRGQTICALQRQGVLAFVTATVWDHLEAQNPRYFQQYNVTRSALAEARQG